MSNIRKIKTDHHDVESFLREFMQECDEAGADVVIVAAKLPSGEWMTGWQNVDCIRHAEAIAHLNVDLIDRSIMANAERFGLHSHD